MFSDSLSGTKTQIQEQQREDGRISSISAGLEWQCEDVQGDRVCWDDGV